MKELINVSPELKIINGEVRISSREIARIFDKEHGDVLRAIKSELSIIADEIGRRNFAGANYLDLQGKKRPEYLLTEKGFLAIGMSFTGDLAKKLRWAVLTKIEDLSSKLRQQSQSLIAPVKREYNHKFMLDVISQCDGKARYERKVFSKPIKDMDQLELWAYRQKRRAKSAFGNFKEFLINLPHEEKFKEANLQTLEALQQWDNDYTPRYSGPVYGNQPMFPEFELIE